MGLALRIQKDLMVGIYEAVLCHTIHESELIFTNRTSSVNLLHENL